MEEDTEPPIIYPDWYIRAALHLFLGVVDDGTEPQEIRQMPDEESV